MITGYNGTLIPPQVPGDPPHRLRAVGLPCFLCGLPVDADPSVQVPGVATVSKGEAQDCETREALIAFHPLCAAQMGGHIATEGASCGRPLGEESHVTVTGKPRLGFGRMPWGAPPDAEGTCFYCLQPIEEKSLASLGCGDALLGDDWTKEPTGRRFEAIDLRIHPSCAIQFAMEMLHAVEVWKQEMSAGAGSEERGG